MTRLLLDAMCGGLRAFLRACGHDTAYALERDVEADDAVLALADAEDRIVVTRDEQLAARGREVVLLTERDPVDQLSELSASGLDLTMDAEPARCGRCNGRLDTVDRVAGEPDEGNDDFGDEDVEPGADALPEYVPDDRDELWRCRDCGQYFWKGSHWKRMERTLAEIRDTGENE